MTREELLDLTRTLSKIVEAQSQIILKHNERIEILEGVVDKINTHQAQEPYTVNVNNTGPDMRKVFPWNGMYN